MSLEDELAKVDQEYARMKLQTSIRTCSGEMLCDDGSELGGSWLSKGDVVSLLLETYQQAIEIGWETKALDSLATKIRETG